MKIHGTNQSNFNPYKDILKNKTDSNQIKNKGDHLEISEEAKKMQQKKDVEKQRESHIQQIKQAIDQGEYEINFTKTAKKMIDFWSGK
ncbi:flagellar biosynthesis anti-sigma factor FlgM [Cerasibacillus terrae]|uniref:Negative regulator of flagellin synthesis n=1 Tax=Cerasibacillus terrae TaxID=2498845 RepID=A0A5C8NVD4_9BACI|nr:flagellar biosynthesis anti-sigma factor FlgM [Cerasibacillus terrae]TXL65010.1 flagellar biosynthesis anti-sigma factor FlgM [Cerasibacillus terrae]